MDAGAQHHDDAVGALVQHGDLDDLAVFGLQLELFILHRSSVTRPGQQGRPGWRQRQTVAGLEMRSRVMGLDCEMPFTVYANVPWFASANVKVAFPAVCRVTSDGFQGVAVSDGPVVRCKSPLKVFAPVFVPFDMT